jgi:hypothetical protein
MQQNVKKQMSVFRRSHIEKVIEHRKMTGARDRQKFRQTLDKTQDDRIPDRQNSFLPKELIIYYL